VIAGRRIRDRFAHRAASHAPHCHVQTRVSGGRYTRPRRSWSVQAVECPRSMAQPGVGPHAAVGDPAAGVSSKAARLLALA
jgi:hypothetical protein